MVFIEPLNKIEQENWLDKLIADILSLNKKEFADLLSSEIEYMLNLVRNMIRCLYIVCYKNFCDTFFWKQKTKCSATMYKFCQLRDGACI